MSSPSSPDVSLSHVATQVQRYDRERFITGLFAAPERREALMTLYAFNVEVATVRENIREPMAGAIRLQWWRDMVGGLRPADETARHPVAAPLGRLLDDGTLPRELLAALIDGRQHDISGEGFADLSGLEAYADVTSGGLGEAAVRVLGIGDEATLAAGRAVGTGFALAGLLRALPFHLSTDRVTLPEDCLAAAGSSVLELAAGRTPRPAVAQAARMVGERAAVFLAGARRHHIDKKGLAALLPATIASAALKRLGKAGWDPFDPKLNRPATAPLRLTINAVLGRF